MHRSLLSLIGLLAVMATSCGDGGSGTLEIVDSWAPPTPPNAPAAVIYLTIDNDSNTADQLVAVSSDDRIDRVGHQVHGLEVGQRDPSVGGGRIREHSVV